MDKHDKQWHSDSSKMKIGSLYKLRLLSAIWVGKVLIGLARILGRGGTTLPGRSALKIAPDLNYLLARHLTRGTVLVTGTNGKTTTAALLSGIIKEAGLRCIHNQSGSNLTWGIATTLIENSTWLGRMNGDLAVLETDEGAFPALTASLQPTGVITTNIFRDQLDRFGEIDSVQGLIQKGLDNLPSGSFQIINADDPSLSSLKNRTNASRWTYGLELKLPANSFKNTGRDIKTCPVCFKALAYEMIYFAHIGHYYCPTCNFKRPEAKVNLTRSSIDSRGISRAQVCLPDEKLDLNIPLLGIYNLYNILAAVACARALDISADIIGSALEKAAPSFGRMEKFEKENKEIIMALIKNPVGANEVLRTIFDQPGNINLIVAINDRIADGKDISWLWDVDFEQLAVTKSRITTVIASGLRAWDMAVRFKYAGFETEKLQVAESLSRAIERALEQTEPGSRLFILPTYTAMLEIRQYLNKIGLGKPYWEDV